MNNFKKWYTENKDKPLFKAKLLLAALILLAVALQLYNNLTEENDTPEINESIAVTEETDEPEKEEKDVLLVFWENSRAHIAAFLVVTAALAVVKCRQKQKIRESG